MLAPLSKLPGGLQAVAKALPAAALADALHQRARPRPVGAGMGVARARGVGRGRPRAAGGHLPVGMSAPPSFRDGPDSTWPWSVGGGDVPPARYAPRPRRWVGPSPRPAPSSCAAGWVASWRPPAAARRPKAGARSGSSPGVDRAEANPHVEIAIPTGMGEARNVLVVRAADAVVAVAGGVRHAVGDRAGAARRDTGRGPRHLGAGPRRGGRRRRGAGPEPGRGRDPGRRAGPGRRAAPDPAGGAVPADRHDERRMPTTRTAKMTPMHRRPPPPFDRASPAHRRCSWRSGWRSGWRSCWRRRRCSCPPREPPRPLPPPRAHAITPPFGTRGHHRIGPEQHRPHRRRRRRRRHRGVLAGGLERGGVHLQRRFFGSAAALPLTSPIVGMAATPDDGGYWLVAADGGVFAYGDARFAGSMGAVHLTRPVVGMAVDAGHGWLLAGGVGRRGVRLRRPLRRLGRRAQLSRAGGGDGGRCRTATATSWSPRTVACSPTATAHFAGSMGAVHLTRPVVGMAVVHRHAAGYWLVAADGGRVLLRGPLRGVDGRHSCSTGPWWAWRRRPTAAGTGWWAPTAALRAGRRPDTRAR